MKKTIIFLATMLTITSNSQAVDFYTNVTNLWFQGYKTNVLAMAEQRLSINSNDMAGLIIKMSYDEAITVLESSSNSISHVLAVGSTITNSHFASVYPELKITLEEMLDFLGDYRPSQEELQNERLKTLIPEKPFIYAPFLHALEHFPNEMTEHDHTSPKGRARSPTAPHVLCPANDGFGETALPATSHQKDALKEDGLCGPLTQN